MADTYTLHKDLVDQANLHITKFHASTHEAGGTDELDWEQIANLKTYIDSQIAGENHWDLESGNVLVPHVANASIDLGSGNFTTTGIITGGNLTGNNTGDQDLSGYVPYTGATTNVDLGVYSLSTAGIQFDIVNPTDPIAEGLLRWNDTDGTLDLGMSGGDVTMQIGQELFTKVRNASGYETISNGQVVYISGRTGVFPDVRKARSDAIATSRVLGVATQDITSPGFGYVTTVGYVRGIKTDYTGAGIWGTTWVTGDLLYVSKTDAGTLTNVEPTVPHHSDIVGTVGVVSGSQGSILITNEKHYTLEELTDVNGTALNTNGQLIVWDNDNSYFDFSDNINNYVPYTGATADVDLGAYDITATDATFNGNVSINAGLIVNTTRVTTTYTVLSTDHVIFANTDSGAFTTTLPVGVEGQYIKIINCGSSGNALTIDGNASETVYGELTQDLSDGDVIELHYNTTEGWW